MRPRGAPGRAGAIRRGSVAALAVLTLAAFSPPALNLLATSVAAALGCNLDEGSPHPCRLWGRDIGASLYDGYVLGGWLSLVTAPAMLVALGVWGAVAVNRWRARRRVAASGTDGDL